MEDPDLIACLYPATEPAREYVIKAEGNRSRYVAAERAKPEAGWDDRDSREPTPLVENNKEPAYLCEPCLALRFSHSPRTGAGFVVGTSRNSDVVLPKLRNSGLSNRYFALAFDDFNHLIVRDLGSRYGTQVTYDGKGRGFRRNFVWIVSGNEVPNKKECIIISLDDDRRFQFQLVVSKHDITSQQYIDNVNRFRDGTADTEGLFDKLNLPPDTQPVSGAQTPGNGPIFLSRGLVGNGTYGVVSRHWNVSTGEEVARKKPIGNKYEKQAWKKEIDIMRSIQHDHIVGLLFSKKEPIPVLYMEFMPCGNLEDEFQRAHFSEAECWQIFSQSTSGLKYLHERPKPIVHRDVKPENILVKFRNPESLQVKLSDFGLSKIGTLQTFCGSETYCAPEIARYGVPKEKYTKAVDSWSLGVVMLRFAYHLPYPGKGISYEWCKKIAEEASDWEPEDMIDILQGMLVLDAGKRSSIRRVSKQIEESQARSSTLMPSSYAAECGTPMVHNSLQGMTEEQKISCCSPENYFSQDNGLVSHGPCPSPSLASGSDASTVVINRPRKRTKQPSKSSSSSRRQHKRHQSLRPEIDNSWQGRLLDPLHPLGGGSSLVAELQQGQSTQSTQSTVVLTSVADDAAQRDLSLTGEQSLENSFHGALLEPDPCLVAGGTGYVHDEYDGRGIPESVEQTSDRAYIEQDIAEQLLYALDGEHHDYGAYCWTQGENNNPQGAVPDQPVDSSVTQLAQIAYSGAYQEAIDAEVILQPVNGQHLRTENDLGELPLQTQSQVSHLSTRSLLFDHEGLVQMTIQQRTVSMRMSDFELNGHQILRAARSPKGVRDEILRKLKDRGVVRRETRQKDFWVPFPDGVFVCQAVRLKNELRPLLLHSGLPIPSQEDNYLLGDLRRHNPGENGFAFLWCDDHEIAYQPSERIINAAHILRAGTISRHRLPNFFKKHPTVTKQTIPGIPRVTGTYISYEHALVLCDHFNLNLAPVQRLLAEYEIEAPLDDDGGSHASGNLAWPGNNPGVIGHQISNPGQLPSWNQSHHSKFTEESYGNGSFLAPRDRSFLQLLE